MRKRFDDSFKKMAVELSTFKSSVSEAAKELDLTPVYSADVGVIRASTVGGYRKILR